MLKRESATWPNGKKEARSNEWRKKQRCQNKNVHAASTEAVVAAASPYQFGRCDVHKENVVRASGAKLQI